MTTAIVKTTALDGWTLGWAIDGAPRMSDDDLGNRLLYGRARNFRRLVRRHHDAGRMPGTIAVDIPTTPLGGRPGVCFWLNEPDVLFITGKACTRESYAAHRALIVDVFRRARAVEDSASAAPKEEVAVSKILFSDDKRFAFSGTAPRRGQPARVYEIDFGAKIPPRSRTARRDAFVIGLGKDPLGRDTAVFGGSPRGSTLLTSLEGDYDLRGFMVKGDARTVPRPERPRGEEVVEAVAEMVPPAPMAAIEKVSRGTVARAEIAGLVLEVVTEEGDSTPKWVTLRSAFAPFGKEVDKQLERLATWANLRKFRLPSQGGDGDSSGNLTPATWCIAGRQVLAALLEMPAKGVPETMLPGLRRFKQEGAEALHAYFVEGVAVNPRVTTDSTVVALLQGQQAILAQLAAGKADRADVERKVDRAEVETIAREVVRQEAASFPAAPYVAPATEQQAGDEPVRGVKALLAAAGLPTEKKPGNPKHFLFGGVAFAARDRIVSGGRGGSFSVRDSEFPAVVATLRKATEEYRRLGWSTDANGNAVSGQHTLATVTKRMIEALRRPSPPQLTLVSDDGGKA